MVSAKSIYTKNALNPQVSMKSYIYIAFLSTSEDIPRQKYLKNYLSIREIAKEFSCSKTKIGNLLLKYKIVSREPSKHHRK